MWRRVKDLLRPVKRKIFGPRPRAKNDYATHVPVLIGLSSIGPIKSVLELGSGQYSTSTFLNREVFPDLEVLDSFETELSWAERMRELAKLDKRASLHLVDGPMVEAVGKIDLDAYDLVFVDDSTTSVDRAKTIQEVSRRATDRSIVVIHDFENQAYKNASQDLQYRHTFRVFIPETGVLWNSNSQRKGKLRRIEAVIRKNSRYLELDDLAGWTRAFGD